MSASSAIAMVGESLRNLLLGEMKITPNAQVTLLGPDESGSARRLNLFLFKVNENPFLRNEDWQLSASDPGRIAPPPLSLNLTYLVTPYAVNDAQTGNTPAHEILGEAMRVLYQNPIVPQAYLVDGLREAKEQIKVTQVPVNFEELSQVWGTFKQAFRTSVLYEVSTVQIDQSPTAQRAMPTRVRGLGVPSVGTPYAPPVVEQLTPIAGPAGTTVVLQGRHLAGWYAYVTVSGRTVADGLAISGDSFSVTVPGDLSPGFHELCVDVSHLFRRTFFFEVAP